MKIARQLCTCASVVFFMLCAPSVAADKLSVAVASHMQYVFDDIKTEFKKETGHEVEAVYNSSGKFVIQIMNGAPFDVFLSADMEYPEYLHAKGFATTKPKVYAYGSVVLWTMKNLDLSQWQTLLVSDRLKKIALTNPKTAPYGREAMRVLSYFKLEDKVQSRLVFGESISQTNQFIHSGVADIGFTAKSVVNSAEMKGQGKWIELPLASYQAIAQGAVMLKHGKETKATLAQQFYVFLYSPKVRAILERNGFILP
jgi:molybdate transport system substrate-binding protein